MVSVHEQYVVTCKFCRFNTKICCCFPQSGNVLAHVLNLNSTIENPFGASRPMHRIRLDSKVVLGVPNIKKPVAVLS